MYLKKKRFKAASYLVHHHDYCGAASQYLAADLVHEALNVLSLNVEKVVKQGYIDLIKKLLSRIASRIGEPNSIKAAQINFIKATCANISGKFEKAITHYKYAAIEKSKDVSFTCMIYNRMGDSYRLKSSYKEARNQYQIALDLLDMNNESISIREIAAARLGIAKMNRLICDYNQALKEYNKSLALFERRACGDGIAKAIFGRGEVLRLMSQYKDAERCYKESLKHSKCHKNKEREAYAYWGIGEILRLKGNLKKAKKIHSKGFNLCCEVGV